MANPHGIQLDAATLSRLVAAREKMGFTQTALAAELGVAQARVAEWERGRKSPTRESLDAWCAALGLGCEITVRIKLTRI